MKKKQAQERLRNSSDYVDCVVSTGTTWAVLYQGECIQLRKEHKLNDSIKYSPTSFSQRGSAERMARKLNALFMTTDFTTAEVTFKTPH
jgi:hypothetical protein